MKALILVGGFGTRLRPLTFSVPKPLVQFINRPILEHQVEALVNAGVTHIILAVNYQPEAMYAALAEMEKKYSVKITCSKEDEPLGTAGPIRLAKDIIMDPSDSSDSFFMFNSDVTCDFPLKEMLELHTKHGGEGTIVVTKVEDPSKFGVVVSDENGQIQRFVEKPQVFVGDCINAGLYLLKKSVINRIEPRPTSIEREIFPKMATEGQLFALKLKGHWADIGQPKDYLAGQALYLATVAKRSTEGAPHKSDPKLSTGEGYAGAVVVHPSAKVGANCKLGPNVVIGPSCVVGEGVRLANTALLGGAKVNSYSSVNGSIIGWHSNVGKWSKVDGLTVLGESVVLAEETYLNGTMVLPHKEVKGSTTQAGTIIM